MAGAAAIAALGVMMLISYLSDGNVFDAFQEQMNKLPIVNDCAKDTPCVKGAYPPPASWQIPKFVINLDLPPGQRWNQLTGAYTDELRDLVSLIKNLTHPIFRGYLIKFIDKHMPVLVETLPYPFADELKGIANSSAIPLGEIALYNIFYEIFTVCTSILAQTESGQLFHARNLDFGLFLGWDEANNTWLATEILRKMTVQLHFQRGGATVFKATSFVGYVGILTGMKPKMFSVTVDERFKFIGGYVGILKWIFGYRGSSWMGFLTRQLMENATSYVEAQKLLAKTELLAPVYFILGGNKSGQASVITRGLTSFDIWEMGSPRYSRSGGNNTWFLVETNYDHWASPPCFDDRRKPAEKCLNELGQKSLSFEGLFNVLSTRPVLNKLTTYTALMEVAADRFESYLQFCPDPCPAF